MEINKIVQLVNNQLAGEMLSYDSMKYLLDKTIDDINTRLNAKFPVFSEFNNTTYIGKYPNYDFFPDKYIRSVVVPGAAQKFYVVDEEGIDPAPALTMEYKQGLFYMERDYSAKVPEEFQETGAGYFTKTSTEDTDDMSVNFFL